MNEVTGDPRCELGHVIGSDGLSLARDDRGLFLPRSDGPWRIAVLMQAADVPAMVRKYRDRLLVLCPPDPAPALSVVACAGIWIVLPIYLRYSGMLSAHRIAYVGYSFVGFFMLPSYSVIGWPTEAFALDGVEDA